MSEPPDWNKFVAKLMKTCHYTPTQVGEMTLAEMCLFNLADDEENGKHSLSYAILLQQGIEQLTVEERVELARRKWG